MKPRTALFLPLLVLALAANGDAPTSVDNRPVNPQAMTGSQIKEHNATLERSDRNYIVCRTMDQTGSQVRKTRMCRTNAEWTRIRRDTREMTQEAIDAANRAPAN